MQSQLQRIIVLMSLALAAWANHQLPLNAAPPPGETAESQAESPAIKKEVRYPFRGKLARVDKKNLTIALIGKEKSRLIRLTPQTRIIKNGKPAKIEDGVPGEAVGGLLSRKADGSIYAVSVRFGPKDGKPNRPSSPSDEPAAPESDGNPS